MPDEQYDLFDELPEIMPRGHFDPDDGAKKVGLTVSRNEPIVKKFQAPVNLRAETMKKIVNNLPLNDLGLPIFIYRSDMIPPDFFDDYGDERDRMRLLDVAAIHLDYMNGSPNLTNGLPIWSQLPFEGIQEFQLFLRYLGTVMLNQDSGNIVAPLRTLEAMANESGQSAEYLRELSVSYYWSYRARAHDLFMVASYHKQRETRAIFVENDQFAKTSKWLKRLEEKFEAMMEDEDIIYDIEPKKLFDMFMEMMKHQRVSVGLPANGRTSEDSGPRNASMEVLMQDIAAKAGEKGRQTEEDDNLIDNLLENPAMLEQLQELIIQTSKKGQ